MDSWFVRLIHEKIDFTIIQFTGHSVVFRTNYYSELRSFRKNHFKISKNMQW